MQDPGLRQRLLAILAADAVAYSRLMAADERATVAALDAARALFRAQVEGFGGRVVDTAGDSVLAVFETAAGAVGAALAVQSALAGAGEAAGAAAPADAPHERRLRWRIGVHLGDVFEKADGSVYGDGVNVAARLQALAGTDGLMVSQAVQAAVQGRVEARFEDAGEQALKNIGQPVRAFRVHRGAAAKAASMPGAPHRPARRIVAGVATALVVATLGIALALAWPRLRAPTAAVAGAPAERKAIAVLPFANLGDDKADEGFADGVTDELIELLSRVDGLRVTPRSSAFHFKGKAVTATEAARQLGVGWLVEGSVRRAGDTVRIVAQLVDGTDGRVMWSRSLDRGLNDVLAAQTDIALGIAGRLVEKLDSSASLVGTGTRNAEAWLAFLEAERLPWGEGGEAFERALAAYRRVIELDPDFVRAYIRIHDRGNEMAASGGEPPRVAGERSMQVLQKALTIDPNSATVHGRLASAAHLLGDAAAMRRHAQRALELDPNEVAALHWMAEIELAAGDILGSIALRERQIETSPLDVLARQFHAELLLFANRPARALEAVERWLALQPESLAARFLKAEALARLGRRDEALALARERRLRPLLALHGTPADREALRREPKLSLHTAALLKMIDGDLESMVAHLDEEHAGFMGRSRVLFDPQYDPIRATPAFQAWLAKHGLADAHARAQAWRTANPMRGN